RRGEAAGKADRREAKVCPGGAGEAGQRRFRQQGAEGGRRAAAGASRRTGEADREPAAEPGGAAALEAKPRFEEPGRTNTVARARRIRNGPPGPPLRRRL